MGSIYPKPCAYCGLKVVNMTTHLKRCEKSPNYDLEFVKEQRVNQLKYRKLRKC